MGWLLMLLGVGLTALEGTTRMGGHGFFFYVGLVLILIGLAQVIGFPELSTSWK